MLITALFVTVTVIALPSLSVSSSSLTRLCSLILLSATALSYHTSGGLESGISLFSGLIQASPLTMVIDLLLGTIGALAILPWAPLKLAQGPLSQGVFLLLPTNSYHALLALFSVSGGSILVSTASLLSLYLGLEMQSFGVYVMAALYRDSETATHAGLVYFLLGGLSSAFILMGSASLYASLGVMGLDEVYTFSDAPGVALSVTILTAGLFFKVAAAPFHQWAPSVYDGVPTIVTTWLQTMPKLSVLGLLAAMVAGLGSIPSLMTVAVLSLTVGSIMGLSQTRIKTLLTYSTISHVGFMLLALATYDVEAMTWFVLYLAQYSFSSLATLMVVLGFGYTLRGSGSSLRTTHPHAHGTDLESLSELTGVIATQPMLCVGMAVLLFSMAGVPPFVGFIAKQGVLEASISADCTGIAIVAIVASAISASYYLKVVRLMVFSPSAPSATMTATPAAPLTAVHTFSVSVTILVVGLWIALPSLILDSIRSLALGLFV
jgi:NADH-ubiquinone oxidoreductase chain 2